MVDGPWIDVVGIGADGLEGLGRAARATVDQAEVLVGGTRHQGMVPRHEGERIFWLSPLADTLEMIESRRGRRIVVLATGDPMGFGVGETLVQRFGEEAVRVQPFPSAFALACARLGWSRFEIDQVSLHGRPLSALRRHVRPGARIVALTSNGEAPQRVAAMLRAMGYGPSRMTVLEHMGGPRERRFERTAEDWPDDEPVDDFNTLAVACAAERGTALLSATPGLPDSAFRHDGMLTKREVRACTLARLAPVPGQLLWDIGAGCGSVAVEWVRACGRGGAWAIEAEPARCALIALNAEALGTPEVRIVNGRAPDALEGLAQPDAVFVGGGVTEPGLLERAWSALRSGGRLVANAVSLEGARRLEDFALESDAELVRLWVERVGPLGGHRTWRPTLPVVQLAAVRP